MSYGDVEPRPPLAVTTTRDVDFEHSSDLGEVLGSLGVSLLISTYQANQVVLVQGGDGKLDLSFHSFDRPMGLAVDSAADRLAIATNDKIWFANNEVSVARQFPSLTAACFLTRSAHVTGDIQTHQMAWADDELWIVNTRFSCLCTLDERNSFVGRWRPNFIDALAAEDRCHINGVAMRDGQPCFVTMHAASNVAEGWRPTKHESGCLMDVTSNSVVAEGFAMPHSPVVFGEHVLVLDSGRGILAVVTPNGGKQTVARFPGFTRGLAVHQNTAVVGLSKIRETSTFSNLPISNRSDLKCGFAIVDLRTGKLLSQFEFKTGVEEIFDIQVIPQPGRIFFQGPNSLQDGQQTIWQVPHSE